MKKLNFILLFRGFCFLSYALCSVSFANPLDWPKILTESHGKLKALEGGYTNEAFILNHQGKKYVVKHLASNALELGVNRTLEFDFQQNAAARGLTSTIHYVDEKKGFYVADYLEENPPRQATLNHYRMIPTLHIPNQLF